MHAPVQPATYNDRLAAAAPFHRLRPPAPPLPSETHLELVGLFSVRNLILDLPADL